MAVEVFADDPTTSAGTWSTLASGYTSGATTLAITSNAKYAAADPTAHPPTKFRFRIDNELFVCTDNRTTTWTVAGAQEGSSAANHSSGATVTQLLSKGSYQELQARAPYLINVRDYGAKGDAFEIQDAVLTTGSTTMSSASTTFTSADVGKLVIIYNAAQAYGDRNTLVTPIASVTNSHTVVLTTAAQITSSGHYAMIGTDDTAAITLAIAAMVTGSKLYFPTPPSGAPGRYLDQNNRNFDNTTSQGIVGDNMLQSYGGTVGQPPSQWLNVSINAATDILSARGSVGFSCQGIAIYFVTQDFYNTVVNLAGNTNITAGVDFARTQIGCWPYQAYNQAASTLDLRGVVGAVFRNCTFQGGSNQLITAATGTKAFSNAVTFDACNFAPYARIVQGTSGVPLNGWTFAGCTSEGSGPSTDFAFKLVDFDTVSFNGGGLYDASAPYFSVTGTAGPINLNGVYVDMPANAGLVQVSGSLDGLNITGCGLVQPVGSPSSVLGTISGTLNHVNVAGNRLGSSVTDNSFLPNVVSGLTAWYKADGPRWTTSARTTAATADTDPVGAWDDSTGLGHHLLQATTTKRPLLKLAIQNGRPVIRFDGTDDFLQSIAGATPTGEFSAFFVAIQPASGGGPKLAFNDQAGSGSLSWYTRSADAKQQIDKTGTAGMLTGTNAVSSGVHIRTVTRTAASVYTLYRDGVADGSTTSIQSLSGTQITVSSDPNGAGAVVGDYCEILYYNVLVTTIDQARIEAYLRTKWATP